MQTIANPKRHESNIHGVALMADGRHNTIEFMSL